MQYGTGVLQVTDDEGLIMTVVTFKLADDPANPPPPDGWTVSRQATGYDAERVFCGFDGTPERVVFSVGNESLSLLQGESGNLGDYTVNLLVAETTEFVEFVCFDGEPTELSYVIVRS